MYPIVSSLRFCLVILNRADVRVLKEREAFWRKQNRRETQGLSPGLAETGSAPPPCFQNMPFELALGMFEATHGAEFFESPTSCSVSQCSTALPNAPIL